MVKERRVVWRDRQKRGEMSWENRDFNVILGRKGKERERKHSTGWKTRVSEQISKEPAQYPKAACKQCD